LAKYLQCLSSPLSICAYDVEEMWTLLQAVFCLSSWTPSIPKSYSLRDACGDQSTLLPVAVRAAPFHPSPFSMFFDQGRGALFKDTSISMCPSG